jgi:hypothetical protein
MEGVGSRRVRYTDLRGDVSTSTSIRYGVMAFRAHQLPSRERERQAAICHGMQPKRGSRNEEERSHIVISSSNGIHGRKEMEYGL